MKTKHLGIIWVLALQVAWNTVGQASFALVNRPPPAGLEHAPVFDADGYPLEGPVYVAELWGGVEPDSLSPAARDLFPPPERVIVPFRTGDRAGYFSGGDAIILGTPAGGEAWLRVRAWDTRVGATYEEAVARGLGGYGESPLFFADGGNPASPNPEAPKPLYGLQSFRLLPVIPEPSTWLLLAVGGVLMRWVVRKRCLG